MMDKKEILKNDLHFKDLNLYDYMKKGPLSQIEAILHMINIFKYIKIHSSLSKEKYLFTNMNSSNIIISRSLDIKINFVRIFVILGQKLTSRS